MKMKMFVFAVIILNFSCSSGNSKCSYYSGDLLRDHSVRIKIREVDKSTGVIYRITDAPSEGTYFGSYEFREDGSLKSYKFFGNDSAYIFNEEFDLNGSVTSQLGTPLVRTRVKDVNKDSIFLRLYFSTLFRKFDTVTIQIQNRVEKNTLTIDTLYTNIQMVSWGLNIRGQDSTEIMVIARFKEECTGQFKLLNDTISLIKKDKLHYLLPRK